MGSVRGLLHRRILVGLVAVFCAAGCSKEPTKTHGESSNPQTVLTFAPMESDTALFRVHVYWSGTDDDGEVVKYHLAVDNDSLAPINYWKTTTATDTLLVFPVDPITAVKTHSFKVSAEDNEGLLDLTPASRVFATRTLPPSSQVVRGPSFYNPIVPTSFTFGWTGIDPDGSPTGSRADVDSFQYLLLRIGAVADSTTSVSQDPLPTWDYVKYGALIRAAVGDGLPSDFESHDYSGWKWIGVRGPTHRFSSQPPGEYVFAERAVDMAGARETDLKIIKNIRHFTVSTLPQAMGPYLVVRTNVASRPLEGASGPVDFNRSPLEIIEGETVSFSWVASAEAYGGEIAGYTFSLDNDNEFYFPPLDPRLTGATFQPRDLQPGTHTLYVRAVDTDGLVTNFVQRVVILHPAFKDPGNPRAILFVDDSSTGPLGNGSGPSDQTETDWWTLGPGGQGPLFSLGVPYAEWDTIDEGRGSIKGRVQPSLHELIAYTTVVWTTDNSNGGSVQTGLFKTVADANYSELQAYLRAGGTLILTGWSLAAATSGQNNLTFNNGGPAPNGMCATYAPGSREYDQTIFPRMYMGIDNSLPNVTGLRSQGAYDFVRAIPTTAGSALGFDTARVDTGNFSYGVQYPSGVPGAITFKWNTDTYPVPAFPDQRLYPGVAGIEAWIMSAQFGCQPIQSFGVENPAFPVVQPIYAYDGVPEGILMDGAPSPREGHPCASLAQSHDLGTNSGVYDPRAAVGRIAFFTFPLYYLKDADAVDIMKRSFAYVNASPTLP